MRNYNSIVEFLCDGDCKYRDKQEKLGQIVTLAGLIFIYNAALAKRKANEFFMEAINEVAD